MFRLVPIVLIVVDDLAEASLVSEEKREVRCEDTVSDRV